MKIIAKTTRILLVIMILAVLGGCALFKLRGDVKISKDSCLLFGEVLHPSRIEKPIIVVAYSWSAKPSRSPIMLYCRGRTVRIANPGGKL